MKSQARILLLLIVAPFVFSPHILAQRTALIDSTSSIIGLWQIVSLDSAGFKEDDREILEHVRLQFDSSGECQRIYQRIYDEPFSLIGTYSVSSDTIHITWHTPEEFDGGLGIFSVLGDTLTLRRIDREWHLVQLFRVKNP